MIILGIETSCDETALALIETRGNFGAHGNNLEYRIIESLVHSQAELHSAYGGVFPNLAKREHSKNLIPLLKKLLDKAGESDLIAYTDKLLADEEFESQVKSITTLLADKNQDLLATIGSADFLKKIPRIDQIAVTEGPGLEPALWVGINFARILGTLWGIPVSPINHMEGHIVGSLLQSDKPYGTWQSLKELALPAIALLISGGHTELVSITESIGITDIKGPSSYKIIGQTKDDAVGEAFDKVARLLELPYPGGPHVSKLAYEAREKNISSVVKLPRPMIKSGDLDFSFSGLKTAVLYAIRKPRQDSVVAKSDDTILTYEFRAGLAREFEDAVAETLDSKLRQAIIETSAKTIIVGGGVSANRLLRERFTETAAEYSIPIYLPDHHISGDNALMIAIVVAVHGANLVAPENSQPVVRADGTKKLG